MNEPAGTATSTTPDLIHDVQQLEDVLSTPTPEVVESLRTLSGPLLILGVGGKMGPTLARMARRALDQAGMPNPVIGVSRFSEQGLEQRLHDHGVETISADLLDRAAVARLPDAGDIIFMAGRKFGSTGAESLTWAMNTYLPGLVAERYAGSRTVAFSTGNVYPLVRVASGGADEDTTTDPVGEYAQSCLGRERILEHFSLLTDSKMVLLRLSYAIDLRYGVLLDVAQRVAAGQPVDVTTGHASIIWQGDASAQTLQALQHCQSPPLRLNVTGPETVSIRWLAGRLGQIMGKEPVFAGDEAPTALVVNASRAHGLFGYPRVPLDTMIRWTAHWVTCGGATLDKPTHFEQRDGRF